MTLYLQLFWEFFKTGLFAIGGGMATLPFLYDISDKTGWFTHTQLADMIAVSESTPGPIGVNMATYVGFLTGGIGGALVATLGLITPSVIVILIVAAFLKAFRDSKYVAGAFYGLRPASTALITAALVSVARVTFFVGGFLPESITVNWKAIVLAAVLLVLTRWTPKVKNWHPIVFIAFSALVGAVFRFAGA
ncbi:MAG: chromate transporter [Eubacteriales bacterium]|nr:chromate transporter [Eubacteriales bacterium]